MVESKASDLSSYLPAVERERELRARASPFCFFLVPKSGRLDVLVFLCLQLSYVSDANHSSTITHVGQVLGSTDSGDLFATAYSPIHLCLQS